MEVSLNMNKEQFEQIKKILETHGVKFTNDDGTYKSLNEVFCQLSYVWHELDESEKDCLTRK
ncbi:MAG: hypothetical protein BWY47_00069 [Bacteroidetes bacterium ADurb.Bin302]|nr:MAG: hypothetical protein BWY47_00069 [Bacteroidetes bacterium ADurb.Bin302]